MGQVRTECYEEMSSCLKTFASQLTELASELQTAVKDAADNLDDDHTREVEGEVKGYCKEYHKVAKAAVILAQQLDEERENYIKAYTKHI